MKHNNQKSHDVMKKSRFVDEIGKHNGKIEYRMVKFYSCGKIQAVIGISA